MQYITRLLDSASDQLVRYWDWAAMHIQSTLLVYGGAALALFVFGCALFQVVDKVRRTL